MRTSGPAMPPAIAPLAFLATWSDSQLREALAGENLQTVALVASYLPKEAAIRYLAGLEAEVQADVTRRIAELRQISSETLSAVADGLMPRASRRAA